MSATRYVSIFSVALIAFGAGMASGQSYPSKPIRFLTGAAGGGNDIATRIIAQGIAGPLGQPVVVENFPVNLIGEMVKKSAPDGYTIMFGGASFMFAPLLRPTPYDPVKDFSAITITGRVPNVLVVHPSLPVKTVKDLVALAKAKPGELNYSFAGFGGSTNLAAELFNSRAGISIVGVNYKSSGAALNGVMSGEVQVWFADVSAVGPHVKSGKLRALAVTSPQPSAMAPGLPTVAATVPGVESVAIDGIWAPGGTPAAIVTRLNQEIVRFLNTPDAKEKFLSNGSEIVGSTPDELAATVKADIARWAKVIKDAGIKTRVIRPNV